MEWLARYEVIKFNKIYNFMDAPQILAELSKRVNRDPSTLSSAAKYLEKQAQKDIQLAQLMNKIREELYKIQLSQVW